jgi:MFS transporter, DHA1 family, multidrug resistance protein
MCMAICRDRYEGLQRKHALAYVGIVLGLAPMIAPLIGATLLKFANWRAIFAVQGTLGILTLAISLRYVETATERVAGHVFALMKRYGVLLRNRRYTLSNAAMGLILGPFYGFIAFAPIVYIQLYGLSNHAFSVLFGVNAAMGMLGAFVCTRVTRCVSDTVLLTVCLIGCVAGGAGVLIVGGWHYLAFAGCMGVFTFFCGMSRPLSNNLILEQVQQDIGSASSFIVFYQFMVGAVCMRLVSASWSSPITVFGILAVALPTAVLAFWPLLLRLLSDRREAPAAARVCCVAGKSE